MILGSKSIFQWQRGWNDGIFIFEFSFLHEMMPGDAEQSFGRKANNKIKQDLQELLRKGSGTTVGSGGDEVTRNSQGVSPPFNPNRELSLKWDG
jgi:hypothetical protein